MSEFLKISLFNSPREISRRVKEIDKGYRETIREPVNGIKNLAI